MNFSAMTKQPIKLKEDNSNYALNKSKEITGYFKVEQSEEACFIVVTLDNIKFFPNGEYIYTLVLAGTKDEKRCYYLVGTITLTEHGHGEASFCINPLNLDGRGSVLSDYSTVIVAAMSTVNNRESLHPVLKASLPSYEKGNVHQSGEGDNGERTAQVFNSFYNTIVIKNCIELAKKQAEFADIVPFAENPLEIVWKRIHNYCELPLISPGAKSTIIKYGHFLWGYNDKHYFIAVPGRNLKEEQPDLGKSGFVYWQPILGMESTANDTSLTVEERKQKIYGYWLLAINRYNGYIEEFSLIEE